MKQYFIGIDIGTSAAKTLLMDEHGVVTAQVSREYPLYQPANGWAEQDPEDWRNAVFSAVRELMERSQAEPEQVMGIGFSGRCMDWLCWMRTENQFGALLSGAIRDRQRRRKKCVL